MLCDYYKNTKYSEFDIDKFKQEKRVRSNVINNNRTICQMLRNFNKLTKFKHEQVITKLIKYIHDSVLKLRVYKSNFDDKWWNDHKNMKKRSKFTELKKRIVLTKRIIDIDHFIFVELKELYSVTENYKDVILEILYYLYKINLKFLEYEIFEKQNEQVFKTYNEYWRKIKESIMNENVEKFDSVFMSLNEFGKKSEIDVYYLNKVQTIKFNYENIKKYFDLSRKYTLDIINRNNFDCVIEFGCGWGRNIFHFVDKIDNLNIIGGEYTPEGVKCFNYIKDKFYSDKSIKIFQFDYNNPELFFENLSILGEYNNILCLSFWAIEQITYIKEKFFDSLLNISDNIKFIHHEPIGWQISNNSLMKENKNGFRNYYNKNLYSVLKKMEDNNKIKINNIIVDFFNFNTTKSLGSLIEWDKM